MTVVLPEGALTMAIAARHSKALASLASASAAPEQISAKADEAMLAVKMANGMMRGISETLSSSARQATTYQSDVSAAIERTGLLAERVESLTTAAQNITGLVTQIDGIALQSKILALNAAVEAAHAGEHGNGFAVVAEAVRAMANDTALMTQEIHAALREIRNSTEYVIQENTALGSALGSLREDVGRLKTTLTEQADVAQATLKHAADATSATGQIARSATLLRNLLRTSRDEEDDDDAADYDDASGPSSDNHRENRATDAASGTFEVADEDKEAGVFIQWSDQLSVGINAIDDDHRMLVSLANRLYDAIQSGAVQAVLQEALGELTSYTVTHFGREESLMQQYHYPRETGHRAQHAKFTQQVLDVKRACDSGNVSVLTLDVMAFLKDWLINHIGSSDRLLGAYLQAQGES